MGLFDAFSPVGDFFKGAANAAFGPVATIFRPIGNALDRTVVMSLGAADRVLDTGISLVDGVGKGIVGFADLLQWAPYIAIGVGGIILIKFITS